MYTTITAVELEQLKAGGSVFVIDVLLPEDYACRHISGAENACVYEMVFLDRIAECVPDREQTIVVYDQSGTSMTAGTAKEKLERAGYRSVAILEGGLLAWQTAGFAVESSVPVQLPAVLRDGVYRIDTHKSVVEWTGRNINNRHFGRIALSEGKVVIANGRLFSGSFVLDMTTISNSDIQDEGWRSMLLRHLKSDDFFDVDTFPTATFALSGGTPIADATPGTANMEIAGSLTIKGTTRAIRFPAMVAAQEDGTVKAQAALDFDRTLFNVCYGSGKLYERLGMHLVNDLISVELFIVTGTVACE
ncbi:MAG TPA: sulfurtransferase [Desulfuromonadales bacterium]|nr:sulfurtransferase [Desulfuromonadales bacterium]